MKQGLPPSSPVIDGASPTPDARHTPGPWHASRPLPPNLFTPKSATIYSTLSSHSALSLFAFIPPPSPLNGTGRPGGPLLRISELGFKAQGGSARALGRGKLERAPGQVETSRLGKRRCPASLGRGECCEGPWRWNLPQPGRDGMGWDFKRGREGHSSLAKCAKHLPDTLTGPASIPWPASPGKGSQVDGNVKESCLQPELTLLTFRWTGVCLQ